MSLCSEKKYLDYDNTEEVKTDLNVIHAGLDEIEDIISYSFVYGLKKMTIEPISKRPILSNLCACLCVARRQVRLKF